jgi:hypothetical protein
MIFESFAKLGLRVHTMVTVPATVGTKTLHVEDPQYLFLSFSSHPTIYKVRYDTLRTKTLNKPCDQVKLDTDFVPIDRLAAVFYKGRFPHTSRYMCFHSTSTEAKDIPKYKKDDFENFEWFIFENSEQRNDFYSHLIQQLARQKYQAREFKAPAAEEKKSLPTTRIAATAGLSPTV